MGKFTIRQMNNGQYHFSLKGNAGEVLLVSEGYTSKAGCMNGIESVKINSQKDDQFHQKKASNGSYYFCLIAQNGQIIGVSQMYKTKNGMLSGIEAVKSNAKNASTEN